MLRCLELVALVRHSLRLHLDLTHLSLKSISFFVVEWKPLIGLGYSLQGGARLFIRPHLLDLWHLSIQRVSHLHIRSGSRLLSKWREALFHLPTCVVSTEITLPRRRANPRARPLRTSSHICLLELNLHHLVLIHQFLNLREVILELLILLLQLIKLAREITSIASITDVKHFSEMLDFFLKLLDKSVIRGVYLIDFNLNQDLLRSICELQGGD